MQAQTLEAELKFKVDSLTVLILEKHPQMPILLREIWKTIKQYPEQVTLLEEEDIEKIVKGLMVQTGVEFVKVISKGTGTKTLSKKLNSLNVDDL